MNIPDTLGVLSEIEQIRETHFYESSFNPYVSLIKTTLTTVCEAACILFTFQIYLKGGLCHSTLFIWGTCILVEVLKFKKEH